MITLGIIILGIIAAVSCLIAFITAGGPHEAIGLVSVALFTVSFLGGVALYLTHTHRQEVRFEEQCNRSGGFVVGDEVMHCLYVKDGKITQ